MSQNHFLDHCGWLHSPEDIDKVLATCKHPLFAAAGTPIKDSGKGKVMLLFKAVEKVRGGVFNVRTQAGPDCVSFGAAGAVDCVKAVEIVVKGEFEEWVAETCTEDIYGGSRVNIGNGELGMDGGSFGAWAAKYVSTIGTLVRKKYDLYDLSTYNYGRAENWGMPGNGVPDALLRVARDHRIQTVSLIKTYEEARDALANGYAITIASNQGFSSVRDSEGFAAPEGEWPHQMYLSAVDDVGEGCSRNRPGCLIQNSWGNFNSGPKRHGQPDGSFWVDADVLEERILSMGDSWAYSNFDGFQPQKINLRII